MRTGIYFLIKRKSIVYVGQTISFPKRLSGHCAKDFDTILKNLTVKLYEN